MYFASTHPPVARRRRYFSGGDEPVVTQPQDRYAIVRTRFSKGDVLSEEILRTCPDAEAAQAYLDAYRETVACGFRWPDWDEVRIVERIPSG